MRKDKFIVIAILFAITTILLGAIGAHYLKNIISEDQLKSFNTCIRYQMFHTIALLILALNNKKFNHHLNKSLYLMTIGTLLFSFSIYLLSLQDLINISLDFIGPITPLGGIVLILSWIILLISIKKSN